MFVTNELRNSDTEAYEEITPQLRVYDRNDIAARILDLEGESRKLDKFVFDTALAEPLELDFSTAEQSLRMFVFPASALQLVHLDGIADGSLFRENVRYDLGNTGVNKSIRQALARKAEHGSFILGHNGIIILSSNVDNEEDGKLGISDYSVVNGAQSLTSFYNEKSKLTNDLRVLVRVIEVEDEDLARRITESSNNQNAIRPRDLRSNHVIQRRLQREMETEPGDYFLEIKRGEKAPTQANIITNDEVGRALLAFDLLQPWSAHQIYKVFDEKYADIFGRPEVNARRVLFVHQLANAVDESLSTLKNKPMASYTLTKYFVLYVLSLILRGHEKSSVFVADPSLLNPSQMADFMNVCDEILKTVVVDLNYEATAEDFDYKTVFKNSTQAQLLAQSIVASYEKDVAREKAESFDNWGRGEA